AAILLVDEADAIAQSRELAQMHHEDRAGVNAVIRAVDSLRRDRVPVLTIMCTNRVSALDPAIARRAAYVFSFVRPDEQQRAQLLSDLLAGTEISAGDIAMASSLLGPNENRRWGATYSDLRQRFVPDFVLAAYAGDTALTRDDLIRLAEVFAPTRPFGDTDG
ncbi:MAG: AAA family ATPase, partial [Mycolicibacterium frederiksbergense]|nr:AAA family ATPase [Mycolicibacterium frederiksbergense]